MFKLCYGFRLIEDVGEGETVNWEEVVGGPGMVIIMSRMLHQFNNQSGGDTQQNSSNNDAPFYVSRAGNTLVSRLCLRSGGGFLLCSGISTKNISNWQMVGTLNKNRGQCQ